ncbi:uncharacterized protein LOC110645192 isoform X2 [Hevea brasiliensis]|uniref:uncharacterized protein LOC110645192 isoform X2 n=1 Tax=Hevea brasiliensis TaxID=3981 RepID=UPI0025E936A2|nr:uncharacterized protein LOC110645192 isoform X2 [Hevea brasiliensis]
MAEASKGRVTITLGRTGQVVKRAAAVSEVDYDDPLRGAGNKRSVRDRLGSSFESFPSYGSLANNKRQRGDSYLTSLSANGVEVSTKPAAPLLGQLPPPTASGILQKSSYVGEEQQTVEGLLHSLGLGKYAILFKAEEVDMTALKQMGESDLKELGIPMGPRKKILLALLPLSKRQPR